MAKEKSRKVQASASPEAASAPASKIRRVNTVKLIVPELPQRSGNLLVCGQNDVGQLGLSDDFPEKTRPFLLPEVSDIVVVQAGGMHSLALTTRGEIWTFGCNDEGALGRNTEEEEGSEMKPTKIKLPGKVVRISAGDSHSACLLDDGRVFAWGSFRVSSATYRNILI